MITDVSQAFDGHIYQAGEDLPDLGSFRCSNVDNGMREYMGLSKDVEKLPTVEKYPQYKDLKTGSSAYCLDTGDFYFYSQTEDKWFEQ